MGGLVVGKELVEAVFKHQIQFAYLIIAKIVGIESSRLCFSEDRICLSAVYVKAHPLDVRVGKGSKRRRGGKAKANEVKANFVSCIVHMHRSSSTFLDGEWRLCCSHVKAPLVIWLDGWIGKFPQD